MNPSKFEEFKQIVDNITYKPDWSILYKTDSKGTFIQIEVVNSVDSVTKESTNWKSGKRYLSEYMCRQEIVGTVYSLIEAAEIHEMREWFRYKKVSIYNPHLDPDSLVEVAKYKRNFNCRGNAMSMEESNEIK